MNVFKQCGSNPMLADSELFGCIVAGLASTKSQVSSVVVGSVAEGWRAVGNSGFTVAIFGHGAKARKWPCTLNDYPVARRIDIFRYALRSWRYGGTVEHYLKTAI